MSTYRLVLLSVLCAYRSHYHPRIIRTVRCKPRSHHWWRAVQNGVVRNEWWKENLRMSRDTFTFTCGKLRPYIEKQVYLTNLCTLKNIIRAHYRLLIFDLLFLWKRVAVTVWKLATNVEYRTLSSLFGLGRSTVGKIVIETCRAISTHLLPQYVQIPCEEKLREIVDGFETFLGFPQAAGAIDGSHIPIIRPDEIQTTTTERGITPSLFKRWLIIWDYLWMYISAGLGKSMTLEFSSTHLCTKEVEHQPSFLIGRKQLVV